MGGGQRQSIALSRERRRDPPDAGAARQKRAPRAQRVRSGGIAPCPRQTHCPAGAPSPGRRPRMRARLPWPHPAAADRGRGSPRAHSWRAAGWSSPARARRRGGRGSRWGARGRRCGRMMAERGGVSCSGAVRSGWFCAG
eukprot:6111584-Prymnesium_polylepis.1